MSEDNTGKTVYFTLDPSNPPEMSSAERERFEPIRDEDIDFSDIPHQTGISGWSRPGILDNAELAAYHAEQRHQRVFIEADVLEFFNDASDRTARINEILREYVAGHRRSA